MTKFDVYYMRPEFFRHGIMGIGWLEEHGNKPTPDTLDRSHVHLKTLTVPSHTAPTDTAPALPIPMEAQLEHAYHYMQGEVWSPNGEARGLIRSKGLQHTSMSVGDVLRIKDGDTYIVDTFGFTKL